jgi:hypothetical protein
MHVGVAMLNNISRSFVLKNAQVYACNAEIRRNLYLGNGNKGIRCKAPVFKEDFG